MTTKNLTVYTQVSDFGRVIDIQMAANAMDGTFNRLCLEPVKVISVPDGLPADPAVRLSREQAQQLMDGLWDCGIRPTQGSGSAGSLAATQKHLEDMRAIALGQLKKDGVL